MRIQLLAGVALAAALTATGAQAAQPNGFYGALDIGAHEITSGGVHTRSSANDITGNPYGYKFSIDDPTWVGFARLGYQLTPHWRIELEGGYRDGDDLTSVRGASSRAQPNAICTAGVTRTQANPVCGKPDGKLNEYSVLGNVIYQFLPDSRIDPFLGFGVGVSRIETEVFGQFSGVPGAITAANPSIQNFTIDDDDTAFAYQGIAGVAYHATERLSIDLTYRFLGTADHRISSTGSAALQPGVFRGHYNDQSVTIGLRWNFGAIAAPPPPPPPPPPPTPAPPPPPPPPPPPAAVPEAREFVVYFPFDQSILTTDAQAVVQAAADYAKGGNATRVVVVGHTDTSGSTAYNVRLSERRARTVADALVGLGVGQSVLSVDWKGESAPAVATGDGVKEPLNRRATININFGG